MFIPGVPGILATPFVALGVVTGPGEAIGDAMVDEGNVMLSGALFLFMPGFPGVNDFLKSSSLRISSSTRLVNKLRKIHFPRLTTMLSA